MLNKVLKIIGVSVISLILLLFILGFISSRPLEIDKAEESILKHFDKISRPNKDYSGFQGRIYSKKLNLDIEYANGISKNSNEMSIDQPYHIASIGKLFTATLIFKLIDNNTISIDDKITSIYNKDLGNLFVYNNVDYSNEITFRHLLSHTSGIADYFDGPVINGETLAESIKNNPDKIWEPIELLNFSKNFQNPIGVPGTYGYSDTGYILLGLILEEIYRDSFESIIEKNILKPLDMNNTYIPFRLNPISSTKKMADIWLNKSEISDSPILSIDWAGGGIISTMDDMLKFNIALHNGNLIKTESLDILFSNSNKFEQGIYTGTGGMSIRFKEFFPLLNFPVVNGHIGILSTHLFYDPITDTHIILNFGSTSKMVDSFKTLIEILSILNRIAY